MENHLTLTLLIPTYNEAEIIQESLERLSKEFDPDEIKTTEVFILDDGTDDLPVRVAQFKARLGFARMEVIRNSPPLGKGGSLAVGFARAAAPIAGFLDIDLSTPPNYIAPAVKAIREGSCDAYIGSRRMPESVITRKQFFLKDFLGFIYGYIAKHLIWGKTRQYVDSQCGFKFYKSNVAKILYKDLLATDGLNDMEVLLRANILGLRVVEKGVIWNDIRESKRSLKRILWGEIKAVAKIILHYRILSRYSFEQAKSELKSYII